MTQNSMDMDQLRNAAYLAKSLSDGNRLRILQYISHEKKSVSEIVNELNLSQPLVSHHLKELKHALLVRVECQGPFVYYQIADTRILETINALGTIAENLLVTRKNL
jgi:DNA-binding transcriptional ArsR family regulator